MKLARNFEIARWMAKRTMALAAAGVVAASLLTAHGASAANLTFSSINIVYPSPLVDGTATSTLLASNEVLNVDVPLYLTGPFTFWTNISITSPLPAANVGVPNISLELYSPTNTLISLLGHLNPLDTITDGKFDIIQVALLDTTISGPYHIKILGNAGSGGGNFSLTVASTVPIPAAALLFGSGLAFLGFAGRRKATQA